VDAFDREDTRMLDLMAQELLRRAADLLESGEVGHFTGDLAADALGHALNDPGDDRVRFVCAMGALLRVTDRSFSERVAGRATILLADWLYQHERHVLAEFEEQATDEMLAVRPDRVVALYNDRHSGTMRDVIRAMRCAAESEPDEQLEAQKRQTLLALQRSGRVTIDPDGDGLLPPVWMPISLAPGS
jgi:hypothetical protein